VEQTYRCSRPILYIFEYPKEMTEPNPHPKELDGLEAAQTKWAESEWHLEFLRSEGNERSKTLNDEELLIWAKNMP